VLVYHLTREAGADIGIIWRYIAEHSPDAADRVAENILDTCERLAQNQLIGHSVKEIGSQDLRFWTLPRYRNYTIIYRPSTTPLEIVRVLHGRRNWKRILG
jgi:antitoxin ParD1/3/4/toxin ParE1/3/4